MNGVCHSRTPHRQAPLCDRTSGAVTTELPPEQKPRKKKKKKPLPSSKGVETLYRTTIPTLVAQAQFADNKASIMMSINGVIISILVAFREQIATGGIQVTLPGAIMAVAALGSAICSILAAMPSLSRPTVNDEALGSQYMNLLYFGIIEQLDRERFATLLSETCADPDRVYRMLSLQIHGLGHGLSRKFRLLRYSYILFLYGLVLGALFFLLTSYVHLSAGPL